MYRDIPENLRAIVEPVVEDHGLELVDAGIQAGRGRARVRVVIDTRAGDGRVLLDQCAEVSREIGHGLDARDAIAGAYLLEVTSPGVDRVLARKKDFERAVGSRVAIETREPLEGRRRFRGPLESFDGREVRVRVDRALFAIPFESIAKASAVGRVPAAPPDARMRAKRPAAAARHRPVAAK
ncbi:MAG: ribosome maturation factor RimP [Proteobacteria bacterium]|nr:ribosome maturation factor RimP [Pseudomonadota bacterium]